MSKKLTKLEKELLSILNGVTFYAGHSEHCSKIYYHNPNLPCDCDKGWATIRANIILNKFGMGFYQYDIDKILPERDE